MTLRRPRGFTAVELAIVLGIVAVLAATAWASLSRLRPRARLAGSATELRSLLYGARQALRGVGVQDSQELYCPLVFGYPKKWPAA